MITIYPFDNVIKFILANQISEGKIEYMDLTNMGEIKLVIKNQNISTEATLFSESGEIDLSKGFLVFKLVSGKINDVRRIYDSGVNVFYIISTQQNTSSVIYSGLYKIYDSIVLKYCQFIIISKTRDLITIVKFQHAETLKMQKI